MNITYSCYSVLMTTYVNYLLYISVHSIIQLSLFLSLSLFHLQGPPQVLAPVQALPPPVPPVIPAVVPAVIQPVIQPVVPAVVQPVVPAVVPAVVPVGGEADVHPERSAGRRQGNGFEHVAYY